MKTNNNKLILTNSAKNYFKTLSVDVTNNACGAVYMHGSMRNVTAAISKILQINPGVEVGKLETALIKVVDETTAIVDACVCFTGGTLKDDE